MKRFVVFAGWAYYPGGGWTDFVSAHDTIEEARDACKVADEKNDWSHIVDLEQMKEVV
jgi:hypothetical protein